MRKQEKIELIYPSKENNDAITSSMLSILDRLNDYRNAEEAESHCLMEIKKNDNPMAWLIIALIKLEKGQYQNFGTCLHNAMGEASLDEILPVIRKTAEHLENYLEKTQIAVLDFIDGYCEDQ